MFRAQRFEHNRLHVSLNRVRYNSVAQSVHGLEMVVDRPACAVRRGRHVFTAQFAVRLGAGQRHRGDEYQIAVIRSHTFHCTVK